MSVQSPESGVRDPRSLSVVTPTPLKARQKLLAALIYLLVRSVSATWRCHAEDQSGLIQSAQNRPVIFGLWHNRLALSMMIWGYVRKKQPAAKLVALISASQDGGILSRVLGHFGVQAVRGSSSRRGPQALLELTSWVEQGYHIAITPDGPRGPRYVAQEGIIALAQVTGCPIVPVSSAVRWKVCLKSWDRFQIPLPFVRCQITFGPALCVPRECSDAERETLRQQLEERLKRITRDSDLG
jgi:lysophospholipid acyltransferase (LPLAT)-like uncharacterized protein